MSSWIKDSEELWVTEADVWVASVSEITKKYLFATLRSHTCRGGGNSSLVARHVAPCRKGTHAWWTTGPSPFH